MKGLLSRVWKVQKIVQYHGTAYQGPCYHPQTERSRVGAEVETEDGESFITHHPQKALPKTRRNQAKEQNMFLVENQAAF